MRPEELDQVLLQAQHAWRAGELEEAERIYISLLANDNVISAVIAYNDSIDGGCKRKRQDDAGRHHHNDAAASLSTLQRRKIAQKLVLLWLQTNRIDAAHAVLRALGYIVRLATPVLQYPLEAAKHALPHTTMPRSLQRIVDDPRQAPCRVRDHFLTPAELARLRSVFGNAQADYWTRHDYRLEPTPSAYFSYVIPLVTQQDGGSNAHVFTSHELCARYGLLGHIIGRLRDTLAPWLPTVVHHAQAVELWAHHRPWNSSHQLHFDSDNEGATIFLRHPMVSCVLYLSDNANDEAPHDRHDAASSTMPSNTTAVCRPSLAPTLIIAQRPSSRNLGTHGWLGHVQAGRLVALHGNTLHGVLPGRPIINNHATPYKNVNNIKTMRQQSNPTMPYRTTLMLAFWRRIPIRPRPADGSFRAAMPWPHDDDSMPTWARQLTAPLLNNEQCQHQSLPLQVPPMIWPVYESIDAATADASTMGMPVYDQIFQF